MVFWANVVLPSPFPPPSLFWFICSFNFCPILLPMFHASPAWPMELWATVMQAGVLFWLWACKAFTASWKCFSILSPSLKLCGGLVCSWVSNQTILHATSFTEEESPRPEGLASIDCVPCLSGPFFFTWWVIYPLRYPLHNCVSLFSHNLSWSLLITYFENVCWLVLCQVYIKMWKFTMCITGVCVFTLETWCWDFCKVFKGPLPLKPSDLLLFLGRNCISDQRFLWARKCRVVKRSRLRAKIASYLFSIGRLLCLAFLYGWHFLNKVSLYWPLITLTTHSSTSKLSDNPGDCFLLTKMPCWNCQREEEMGHLP